VSASYGENAGQFAELSELWLTYRLDRVTCEFVPNNPGAGNQSAVVCVRDVGGEPVPYAFNTTGQTQDPILFYSRLKDARLYPNNKNVKMTMDYKGLMMQVNEKPYLQTVDASIGTGVREIYQDGSNAIIPYIRMAYSNTGGSLDAGGY
jgi:hypothetical protein